MVTSLKEVLCASSRGTVTDPSGAATPSAEVRLVNVETGQRYTALADASGNYAFPLVKPGPYALTCEFQHGGSRRSVRSRA